MGVRGRERPALIGDEGSSSLMLFPDEILERIIDLLWHPKDRNAVSRVCKRFHAIEGPSRYTVFISNCYAIEPPTVLARFPNATAITIKGKPRMVDYSFIPHAHAWGAFATPWIALLTHHYHGLTSLTMKRMRISDSDLSHLVSSCGGTLQRLELPKCSGFSTRGLDAVARGCRKLRILSLSEAEVVNEGAPGWLSTLARMAVGLKVLDLSLTELEDGEQAALVELARRCETLKLGDQLRIERLGPVLEAARLTARHLGLGMYSQCVEDVDQMAEAFGRCERLEGLSALWDLDERSLKMVMPVASRIKSLDLTYAVLGQEQFANLLRSCGNLETLHCNNAIGDRGLLQVGTHCKNLKRLTVEAYEAGFVTQHGLMAMAKWCWNLEQVIFYASDMTNEALEILASNCPNLYDVRICMVQKSNISHPVIELEAQHTTLNLGVKALVKKCQVLRRLSIGLDAWHRNGTNVVINDEGMGYIGQYGQSLQILSLDHVNGTTDIGLAAIAFGCLELRKLELRCCPYGDASMAAVVFGVPSLKLLFVQGCLVELAGVKILAQREDMMVEVVKQNSCEYRDWQVVAYSSACSRRTDFPDNIDYVDDAYYAPLYNE